MRFPRELTEQEKDRLAIELSEENKRNGEVEDCSYFNRKVTK